VNRINCFKHEAGKPLAIASQIQSPGRTLVI
jgi:hypothetical protein